MSSSGKVYEIRPSEALQVRDDLDALRASVAQAWRERGVMLTKAERAELRREIEETCAFLTDLIGAPD